MRDGEEEDSSSRLHRLTRMILCAGVILGEDAIEEIYKRIIL